MWCQFEAFGCCVRLEYLLEFGFSMHRTNAAGKQIAHSRMYARLSTSLDAAAILP